MRIIYVAGHYRSDTTWGVKQNIHKAEMQGAEIAKLGHVPLIPHCCFPHWEGLQDDKFFLEATLELMRRCDCVFLLPDWISSQGACGERDEAIRLQIPVFEHFVELQTWLDLKN